jgi:integrase
MWDNEKKNATQGSPSEFVFHKQGQMLKGIYESDVALLFKRQGIKTGNRLHAFRHYFASKLISKGANPATVRELLGHSSIQMTMDLYVHLFPNQKTEAVALLED